MGRPKALLPIGEKTFLDNILDAISRSRVEHTVVVVGHHREEIERVVHPPVTVVFNPNYEEGMITSLQTGIRALPSEAVAALLFLVDHPLVNPETIELLVSKAQPNRIVLPVFEGRRGHPVLFGADILQEILALTSLQGANIVVRKDPSRIIEVPVNFRGILADIDTPDDFQKLQNEHESW